MSTNTAKTNPNPILSASEEEATLLVSSFQSDVVCSKCGLWKTEHDYTVCSQPNWLNDHDD